MQLLKPIQVTLASNVDKDKNLINEELIGQAVMGWIEMRHDALDKETGISLPYSEIMFAVCWIGRTVSPAVSVYRNSELHSLGLAEEFEIDDGVDDQDEYEQDED